MQIDWITVAAQILNFLVLLWILRRLVYAPLSAAMAAREARLRESFARAEAEADAARREAESLAAERASLERRRAALVAAAEDEARALERKLLDAARTEAEQRRDAWRADLARDGATLVAEMRRRAAEALPMLARRALADLASAPLERAIAHSFAATLAHAPEDTARAMRAAADREGAATLETAFSADDETPAGAVGGGRGAARRGHDVALCTQRRSALRRAAARRKPVHPVESRRLGRPVRRRSGGRVARDRARGLCGGSGVTHGLTDLPADLFTALGCALATPLGPPRAEEIGRVSRVGAGVVEVEGFATLWADEMLRFPDGHLGMVMDCDLDRAGVALLGPADAFSTGAEVRRTGGMSDLPVGGALLGRILDPLGRPLDERPAPMTALRWRHERPAPAILDRAPVAEPLHTGVKAVDAAVPIGLGQRELIVGDRQTGKTAIALSAMLSHCARRGSRRSVAIYCAVGQQAASTAKVVAALREAGALARAVIVVAGGETAPGLQALAPFAAATIAEWFMRRGDDALVVFDDLTRHARAWRELSLLLRRPPGREAFPGDIFFLHARLLERATRLKPSLGGGSMTALPVVETQAQTISAYIPTNLISITDGQVYLSPQLFERGQLPAVDVGRSVSRVGGKAQPPALRAIAGDLRLSLAQFEELETFSRFGARLDPDTRARLTRGARVRAALRQREKDRLSHAEQAAVLLAATEGLFDDLPERSIPAAERAIRDALPIRAAAVATRIGKGDALGDHDRAALLAAARAALEAQLGNA